MAPAADLASALARNGLRSASGPDRHGPIALESADKWVKYPLALAHEYGPPATTPTPLITEDQAVPN